MRSLNIIAAVLIFLTVSAHAQQPSEAQAPSNAPPSGNTVLRGCLRGERGNYILVDQNTGMVYVLKGAGKKLDHLLRHEVEVTGRVRPGTIKTGIRPEKSGSNPADTVHGVDGVPLQIKDATSDVRDISAKCKAADKE